MKKLLFFLAGLLLLTGCKQDDTIEPTPAQVNFSNLIVGQKSFYRAYSVSDCANVNNFEWTGDTLVLEVLGTSSGVVLQDVLTEYSPSFNEETDPVQYPVSHIMEGVLLPERLQSALFYFYASDTLRINPTHDVTLQQDECFLMNNDNVFIGNDIGYLPSFEIGEVRQQEKTAVSCEPWLELDGYLIYDKYLHVSHVASFNDIFPFMTVSGWCLLED